MPDVRRQSVWFRNFAALYLGGSMKVQSLVYGAVGTLLGGAFVWIVNSPVDEPQLTGASAGEVTPESPSSQEPSREAVRIQELERDTAELTEELAEAQLEIEALNAALVAAEAALAETSRREGPVGPRGYPRSARIRPDDIRPIFESEPRDANWAPTAEAEINRALVNGISDKGLQITILEVSCRSEACRVLISYSSQPVNETERHEITQPVTDLVHDIAQRASSISYSGAVGHRSGFPGELTTSEVFLFRTGTIGIVQTSQTPPGF
jgi:hypothetical protein